MYSPPSTDNGDHTACGGCGLRLSGVPARRGPRQGQEPPPSRAGASRFGVILPKWVGSSGYHNSLRCLLNQQEELRLCRDGAIRVSPVSFEKRDTLP